MSAETRPIRQEPTRLTPDALIEANQSPLSMQRTQEYLDAKHGGNLVLVKLCADARSGPSLFNTNTLAADRSIAAGTSPDAYGNLIRHKGVSAVIIAPHYDGTKSEQAGVFNGCGGQDAFKSGQSHSHGETDEHPVFQYIQSRVFSENPFVQAFKQKDAVMGQFFTDGDFRPIMVGAIDHRTGLFTPVWHIERDENGIYHTHSTLQSHHIQNAHLITPDHLRPLPDEHLSERFRNIVQSNREYVEANPQFSESQRVQNPDTVFVTTSPIPLRNRYAGLFDIPNKVFVVGVPFAAEVNGESHVVDPAAIMSQLSYPIKQTLEARGEDDPFRDTKTIVFEAGSIAEAGLLAGEFERTAWGHQWLQNIGGRILIAETKSAKTTKAFDYGH